MAGYKQYVVLDRARLHRTQEHQEIALFNEDGTPFTSGADLEDVTSLEIQGNPEDVGGAGDLFTVRDGNGNLVGLMTSDGDFAITGLFVYEVESDGEGGYQRVSPANAARFDPNGPGIYMNQRAGQTSIMQLLQAGGTVFQVMDGQGKAVQITPQHDDIALKMFKKQQSHATPFMQLLTWFDDGSDVFTSLEVTKQGALDLHEQHDAPAAPSSNTARLFCRDNGSGKSQLVCRFPSGAVQVICTEP